MTNTFCPLFFLLPKTLLVITVCNMRLIIFTHKSGEFYHLWIVDTFQYHLISLNSESVYSYTVKAYIHTYVCMYVCRYVVITCLILIYTWKNHLNICIVATYLAIYWQCFHYWNKISLLKVEVIISIGINWIKLYFITNVPQY